MAEITRLRHLHLSTIKSMNMKFAFPIAFILLILPAAALQAQSQINAIDKYFKQYVDDERFTVVYISPKLCQMLGKLDFSDSKRYGDDDEVAAVMEIAKDLQGLRVLISEDDPMELFQEAKSKINTQEYEVLMTVRDKDGDNVEFLSRQEGDIIKELLLLYGSTGDEFILMSLIGNLNMDKILKLARAIED